MIFRSALVVPGQRECKFSAIPLLLLCGLYVCSLNGATFVVTTTADSGAGSLRQAILDANALAGSDQITFQIPGSGVHTIALLSALPPITDPVVIDATTQTGYNASPLVQMDGTSALSASGFRILAGNTVVRGFSINRFALDGIRIETGGTNVIQANFIGTGPAGNAALPNGYEGIFISGSKGNLIGGTNAADRNLISGNSDAGIYLLNSSGNTIWGNHVGVGATGAAAVPNQNNGVAIYASGGNQVGGAGPGMRNVLSGNQGSGVYLITASSISNRIQGNYVGTTPSGSAALANSADGITISGSPANLVGGPDLGEGNLLSGNGKSGLSLSGMAAARNVVQGNFVGTDVTGLLALGNGSPGIWLNGSASNTIGGLSRAAGNLISGNRQDGIAILTNSVGNTVAGNYVGVNFTGTAAVPNAYNGISISGANSNTIGAASEAGRNIVSGNLGHGVQIAFGSTLNTLLGNYIGTDFTGTKRIANSLSGLRIESALNTVGSSQAGTGNLISGNIQEGIFLVGTNALGNLIQGNFIGTAAAGTAALGNGRGGIGVSDAPQNLIGGQTRALGNLISANGDAGIYLLGFGAAGNQILGNRIGTDVTGTVGLGNALEGVYLQSARSNQIGGPTPDSGNLVSANHTRGIFLADASWNVIQANLIGLDANGISPLGNTYHGIECEVGATNNLIGGLVDAPNRIAFAQTVYAGVRIRVGSVNNRISANSIFSNGGLGIDLGDFGITPNDPCDADVGANLQQNFPVLTEAAFGASTGVRGTLNNKANTTLRLEFFATPSSANPPSGQGFLYLGQSIITTGPDCTAAFVAKLPVAAPEGYLLTATATDPENNTSEFSAAIPATPIPALAILTQPGQLTLSWTNTIKVVLNQTASLTPPILWTTVTNVPIVLDGRRIVSLPFDAGTRFYTLGFE